MTDCCNIPQSLIDEALAQWACLADQAYEVFGVDCELIYISSLTKTVADDTNNIPELNSINARRRSSGSEYDFEQDTISLTENSEQIKIKIYWDSKEWSRIFGYTSIPDNAVMIYAKLESAPKLAQAVKIRYTDTEGNVYLFKRHSKPVPCGFKKDRFCSSVWVQEE